MDGSFVGGFNEEECGKGEQDAKRCVFHRTHGLLVTIYRHKEVGTKGSFSEIAAVELLVEFMNPERFP